MLQKSVEFTNFCVPYPYMFNSNCIFRRQKLMYTGKPRPGKDYNIYFFIKKAWRCIIILKISSPKTSFDYNYFKSVLVQNSSFPMVLENYFWTFISILSFIFKAEVIQLLHVFIQKIIEELTFICPNFNVFSSSEERRWFLFQVILHKWDCYPYIATV